MKKSSQASSVVMSSPFTMRSPNSLRSMSTSAQNSQSTPATFPLLPHDVVTCHKYTLDAQAKMHRRYWPYQPRIIPPALELRFASKSIGDTSFSDLGFEDVVEVNSFVNYMCNSNVLFCQGKHKFMWGLSHFSNSVVQKAYVAKMEFRNSILRHIMLCQANINATASRMDLFHAMEQEAQDHLESADEEIKWVKEVMGV